MKSIKEPFDVPWDSNEAPKKKELPSYWVKATMLSGRSTHIRVRARNVISAFSFALHYLSEEGVPMNDVKFLNWIQRSNRGKEAIIIEGVL